jgi:hypothetical protein
VHDLEVLSTALVDLARMDLDAERFGARFTQYGQELPPAAP